MTSWPIRATSRSWSSVNGELVPRDRAVVSVFDSGFVLGDGVWEGLRVSGGHPAFLDAHLDRLYEGAAALLLDVGRSRAELTAEIYRTLRANEMTDGVHVRLMVTRGVKSTAVPGPAADRRTGDGGRRRRAQGPAAGDGDRGPVDSSPRTCAGPRRTPSTRG